MIDKKCIKCGVGLAQTKKRPYCKPCRNKMEREKYDSEKDRNRHLKYWYGITAQDYEKMYQSQKGKCAICGEDSKKLVVDHDHASNKVRSLLCFRCNIALGQLESGKDFVEKAMEYLNYHGGKKKKK